MRPIRLALLAPLLALACATPEPTAVVHPDAPALAFGDANGVTYILTSFDGTSLLGLNAQGRTVTGSYGSTTNFRLALTSKYYPGDPCRQLAQAYNTYYGTNDVVGFNTTLSGMVANSCQAKVLLDQGGVIKTFQPVP